MKKSYVVCSLIVLLIGSILLGFATYETFFTKNEIQETISEETTDYSELGLPLIELSFDYQEVLDTKGEENGPDGTFLLCDNGKDISYQDIMEIRGHGNSTWMSIRKSFHVKLEHKVNLLNLGESKHWILIANPFDDTCMKNKLLYELSGRMGMPYVNTTWVNVTINGEYFGVYLLCEKISCMQGLPVNDGFLYELSGDYHASRDIMLNTQQPISIRRMNSRQKILHDEIVNEKSEYLNAFETAIRSDDFTTMYQGTGVRYDELFDMDALAIYWLVQEFSFNEEMNKKSTYFYQENQNTIMKMGPIWDMDWSSGGLNSYTDETCYWATKYFDSENQAEQWYKYLVRDDKFLQAVHDNYWKYRNEFDMIVTDGGYIDQYFVMLYPSAHLTQDTVYCDRDGFDEECARMKEWYKDRLQWMDEQMATVGTLKYSLEHAETHPEEE